MLNDGTRATADSLAAPTLWPLIALLAWLALPAPTALAAGPPPLKAASAIVQDLDSGAILYQKDPDARRAMASTTKIMTAVVALEHARLTDLFTVSEHAASIGETTMGLRAGEQLTLKDLLYGLLLPSGNDAAMAIAEGVGGGSADAFVAMMNDKAAALGLTNTHYVNPHGFDDDGHYTSARDLLTLGRYAMQNPDFAEIVSHRRYEVVPTAHNDAHPLHSVLGPLYWYYGVYGVKPGFTYAAGRVQVLAVKQNHRRIMAVLMGMPNAYDDTASLLDWALDTALVFPPRLAGHLSEVVLEGGKGDDRFRWYAATQHATRGAFLRFFDAHGGVAIFGYPRTDEVVENDVRVQYFQRARLEYHPEAAGTPYEVQPSLLGDALTADRRPFPKGAPFPNAPDAVYFAETGHGVRGPILAFFRSRGGLGTFGYPISEQLVENGFPVQYFQRARLEYHREKAGTPYEIQLGLLGDQYLQRQGRLVNPDPLP